MPKNRINPPSSSAAVKAKHATPNFKPRNSGAIRRIGPVLPKVPPANKPKSEGVRKSLYINK